MQKDLAERFVRTITDGHGADGARWLARLPDIVREIENDWSMRAAAPYENLSYHFVAPCVLQTGEEAVLKIAFPETDSPMPGEAAMLALYDSAGAVRLLRRDEARFAILLEKLKPGWTLTETCGDDDRRAVAIYIEALRKIIRKPPEKHDFVRLDQWFENFERSRETDFPAELTDKALEFYNELSTAGEKFLLHGDFHHENILSSAREDFLAIDPKGIVGELGYEISVFLNNHVWWLRNEPNVRGKAHEAAARIAEAFGAREMDLKKWAFAQSVLSAWWSFEGNAKNWKKDLALGEIWDI